MPLGAQVGLTIDPDNDSFVLNADHVIRSSLNYERFSVEAE